jgi:cobalt transporter subunit CbtA
MPLFRTLVFVAAVAGAVAGLTLTALQQLSTVPLIRQAEIYEAKVLTTAGATEAHQHDVAGPAAHGWPAAGLERLIFTALANVAGAIGLALLLVALSEIAGGIKHWRHGLFWGLGGFVVFALAPSLSLPPELPGMPSADLASRQAWWFAAAALTGGGLAVIVFRPGPWAAAIGIALILAPHIVGAPQPASFESPVPHELARRFVISVLVSNFVFWAILGGFAGFARSRLNATANSLVQLN